GWYLTLGRAALPTSEFLTPNRAYLMASVMLAFTGYVAVSALPPLRFLERINRMAPLIVGVVTALALIGAFAYRYDHMMTSARGWFTTLLEATYWQGAWPAIVGLAIASCWLPAPPARWAFVIGVPANMALILMLVLNRTPYYFGLGDSAARMAIHV